MTRHKRRREADDQMHHAPKAVEQQSEDSFPASDPPSFSGGNHIIGAPTERETKPVKAHSHRVREAEEKVKSGKAERKQHY